MWQQFCNCLEVVAVFAGGCVVVALLLSPPTPIPHSLYTETGSCCNASLPPCGLRDVSLQIMEQLGMHSTSTQITAPQWKWLQELSKNPDDRAAYHNIIVQSLVAQSLQKQLKNSAPDHEPNALDEALPPLVSQAPLAGNPAPGPHFVTVHGQHMVPVYQQMSPVAAFTTQGARFGNGDPELEVNQAVHNRQQALANKNSQPGSGVDILGMKMAKVANVSKIHYSSARVGRIISSKLDSWALCIMLPLYVTYLITDFSGALSGRAVKLDENPPPLVLEFFDYRTSPDSLKCYSFVLRFTSSDGLEKAVDEGKAMLEK